MAFTQKLNPRGRRPEKGKELPPTAGTKTRGGRGQEESSMAECRGKRRVPLSWPSANTPHLFLVLIKNIKQFLAKTNCGIGFCYKSR